VKFMLDTNICINIIRNFNKSLIARVIAQDIEAVCLSSITLAELEHGVAKSSFPTRNSLALMEFIAPLQVFPFDSQAAHIYGSVKASLQRRGLSIGPLDTLIAAHALSCGLILVTHNTREFCRIEGLPVEDWEEVDL